MHKISVAWNNCFRRTFHVAEGRVSNHYNIFAPHFQYRISFSSANCFFWKKIYWSDNIVLLTLSRLTYNAFIAVGCTFGVLCSHQSYQTMQSKDLCGTHLLHRWNCNCFICVYVLVCYIVHTVLDSNCILPLR